MVIWTLSAKQDLRQIYNFIASDSVHYAKKVTDDIYAKPNTLDLLPRLGRIVPEINDETLREISVYSYRIIYQIHQKNIYVLTIIHRRRDLKIDDLGKINT
ncbi:MAG: type II toxin-antitoxin system RelE/ParE family toxin [Gammaproteobacteria bacterium]|nr:type II toxin-antitoxin system RelE/ParE family toxin [Gammaproteobacteria bacterium]